MQVLVLAVQNAVDYEYLGVATSGSTLFRQVGGSIGVSLFGAIFANQLQSQLRLHFPPGVKPPIAATPALVDRLPPAVRDTYVHAFSNALQPVFLVAAGCGAVAFFLTWFLREVPLRETTRSEGLGESFASPRDDSSFRELQRALSSLASHENRWKAYEEFAARAGVELSPPELWLLRRIDEREPVSEEELVRELGADGLLAPTLAGLRKRSLVTTEDGTVSLTRAGADVHERLHNARCEQLEELLDGWAPEKHAEIRRMVDELADSYAREIPRPATAAS